jgi:hypothetical protein
VDLGDVGITRGIVRRSDASSSGEALMEIGIIGILVVILLVLAIVYFVKRV